MSVIVPVYNGAMYVERALDSVVNQTLGSARIQVLIVDDGSTDESPAILDRMAEEHASFEVFHRPPSGGPATPRNFALERAHGRYVFFLDQDDYLSPDALEAMVGIADENGTDVVIPRMKGVGGRDAPLRMCTRTVPRTDVFSSSAYWTLSPIKLFRTEMVRSLGLRFDEGFGVHEDIGFVTKAYLKGNGISIIAGKDYVFWAQREDASNITLTRMTLAERLPGVSHTVDLVADEVPPGPGRDRLMRRLLEIEGLGSVCKAYGLDPDPIMREAAFAWLRRIEADYYTDGVDKVFLPLGRVVMRLVAEGDPERFAAYLEAVAAMPGRPKALVDGEHVFVALPWFRDPAQGLPDDLFDVAPTLTACLRVEPLEVRRDAVRISVFGRLGPLTDRVTGVTLIARSRAGAADSMFPVAFDIVTGQGSPSVQVQDTVPFEGLLALPKGDVHDLYLRVAAGETWRERKLAECAPVPKLRILRDPGRTHGTGYGLLTTSPKGNLALRAVDGPGLARYQLKRLWRSAVGAVRGRLGLARAGGRS